MRRIYLALALSYVGFLWYGSAAPLQYEPLELGVAAERFLQTMGRPLRFHSISDAVTNLLLGLPLGFCAMGAWHAGSGLPRGRLGSSLLVLSACMAVSLAAEFLQLWFPPRVSSGADVVAQSFGALAGLALWGAAGPTFSQRIGAYAGSPSPARRLAWMLDAYVLALLVYQLLPLDLTLHPVELVRKFRDGGVVLAPLSDLDDGWAGVQRLFATAALFGPAGVWVGRRVLRRGHGSPLARSVLWSLAAAALVELAQVFVLSRTMSSTDILAGGVGAVAGALLVAHPRMRTPEPTSEVSGSPPRFALWCCLAAAYALALVVIFCNPTASVDEPEQFRQRLSGFFRVPFATLHEGSIVNAASQLLRKTLHFAPLGGLLACAVNSLACSRAARRTLLIGALAAAAALAVGIELLQALFPPHVPDITDAMLCTAGAAAGILAGAGAVRPPDA